MCHLDLDLDERKGPTALKTSLVDDPGLHLNINGFNGHLSHGCNHISW